MCSGSVPGGAAAGVEVAAEHGGAAGLRHGEAPADGGDGNLQRSQTEAGKQQDGGERAKTLH